MSIICKKCGYERLPTDDAPEWQCPSCGVAYVKIRMDAPPPKPLIANRDDRVSSRPMVEQSEPSRARPREPSLAAQPQEDIQHQDRSSAWLKNTPDTDPLVIITDVRIPFWSLVWLLVKLAFAAIPAAILVALIWFLIASFIAAPPARPPT